MGENHHLIGSEDVARAGHNMASAADTMRSAAGTIDSAARDIKNALDEHLHGLQRAATLMAAVVIAQAEVAGMVASNVQAAINSQPPTHGLVEFGRIAGDLARAVDG